MYEKYLAEISCFKKMLCDTWHILENSDDLDNIELGCLNGRLYEQILPENYVTSYANPTVAVSSFGTDEGRLLSATAAELRAAIPAVYDRDEEGLNARLELVRSVADLLTKADADARNLAVHKAGVAVAHHGDNAAQNLRV